MTCRRPIDCFLIAHAHPAVARAPRQVCMAVYMASYSRDVVGKMVSVWFPVSAFVALGLEHSVTP